MAFLSFVKSRCENYVYITEYGGQYDYSTSRASRKNHIYALGKHADAIFTLQAWDLNFEHFPNELKEKGYCEKDIKKWIKDLKMNRNKLSV